MKKNQKGQPCTNRAKRIIITILCVFVFLVLLAFLPILLSGSQTCIYEDALLGSQREEIAATWTRVYHRENDRSMAMENQVYELWERENEQMVAVYKQERVCDYLILDQTTGSLRGSVSQENKALTTWLGLRFGKRPNDRHYYDVGSGGVIDSWLTSEGKVVVWWDSAESMVHNAFTMENSHEFSLLLLLNYIVHLPYTLAMMIYYSVF